MVQHAARQAWPVERCDSSPPHSTRRQIPALSNEELGLSSVEAEADEATQAVRDEWAVLQVTGLLLISLFVVLAALALARVLVGGSRDGWPSSLSCRPSSTILAWTTLFSVPAPES